MSNIKFTLNGKYLDLPNGFIEPIKLTVRFNNRKKPRRQGRLIKKLRRFASNTPFNVNNLKVYKCNKESVKITNVINDLNGTITVFYKS